MWYRAAERTDEQDAPETNLARQLENSVTKGPPVQMWLLAQEKSKAGGFMAVESIARHVEGHDATVLDLDVGAEQCVQFHRAGEVQQVEWFGVDFREGTGAEEVHQTADGSGGDVAAVHPAAKGQDQGGPVERGAVVELEDCGTLALGHNWIVPTATPRQEEVVCRTSDRFDQF